MGTSKSAIHGAFQDSFISLRPQQWYKNLLVFAAIIFSRQIFVVRDWALLAAGFVALCCISSAVYLCNDLFDKRRDLVNSEKAHRPIAAGRIGVLQATAMAAVLLTAGLALAYVLTPSFAAVGAAIFALSTLYSAILKQVLFADIIAISCNFVLRAIAGAVIIGVYTSPWLVIGVFFLALYLVTGKRFAEAKFLRADAARHRSTLGEYSNEMMLSLFNIFMAVLIVVFAIFSFSSENRNLLWVTPLFVYLLLRYYYLILSGSAIARNPEKALTDVPMLVGSVLFLIVSIALIVM